MKKNLLFISIILFAACNKEQLPTPVETPSSENGIEFLEMGYCSHYASDTTVDGLTESHVVSGRGIEYVFTSAAESQNASIILKDLNGGLIESGDTLKGSSSFCSIQDTTFVLQTPSLATSFDSLGITTIYFSWCILPNYGYSMDAYVKVRQ